MAYTPISLLVPQYIDGDNDETFSGAVLKAYEANTTTLLQMATDSTGNTLVDDIALNSDGYPEVSNNIVIPHLNQSFKLALYPTQAAADSDTGAIWIIDNLTPTGIGTAQTERVTTVTNLRNYTGQADTIILLGESGAADGSAAIYQKKTGSPAGTYTDNGERVIVPTGGDGSEAWVRCDMDISVKSDVDTHDEDYTLVRNDAGKTLIKTASDTTTRTWTIPLESSVNYPVGTSIRVVNLDNNNLTLVADSTATLRALDGDTPADGNVTVPEGASGVLYKDGSDTWIFYRIGNVDTDSPQTLTNKTISASQITEISNLTAAEGAQLENINSVTISNTQWGYVGGADQPNRTTDTPTFDGAILTDAPQIDIPVSTTSSGGTAGIDYDVADWPGTLVSGRVYYARVHADNIGTFTIDSGGGAVSALRDDGSIPQPLDVQKDAIHAFYFNGTNVLITPKQYKTFAATSITQGSGDKTRIARVELFAQFQDVRFSFLIYGNGSGAGVFATPPAVVHVKIRQGSALGNQPEVEIEIENADKQSFASDCVHAHYGTVDATSSALHIYIADGAQQQNLDPVWEPFFINCESSATIEFFDSSGTATIGSLATTSQAARGDEFLDEDDMASDSPTAVASQQSIKAYVDNLRTTDLPVADGGTGASTASAARSNLGLGAADTPQFTGIEVGNASDTTLTRTAAGQLAVEGNRIPHVVAEESFSIGGDFTGTNTAYAKKVRGNGGDWVKLFIPAGMGFSASSSPNSGANDIPSEYRKASAASKVYNAANNGVYTASVNSGQLTVDIFQWDGTGETTTSSGPAFDIEYFIPDP